MGSFRLWGFEDSEFKAAHDHSYIHVYIYRYTYTYIYIYIYTHVEASVHSGVGSWVVELMVPALGIRI